MRALHIIVAVFIVAAAHSAELDYQLIWSDEFDGAGVDPTKWSFQIGDGCPSLCGWGNNELQYYRAENAIVSGGLLTITAREESFGGRDYTSARMRTINLGDWKYGRFEMRAQMPVGQGLWPAFWMLPTDNAYGGWAASGEIDIMEYLGQSTDHASCAIHYGGSWPGNVFWSKGFTLPAGDFSDSMHEFALEWGPHEMRWYVDGERYACQSHWSSSGGGYPAPFDQEFHILLNMAVGGYLPGPPDETTSFPQDLVVDHVRVYQRPEFAECEILFDGMDHADPSGANGWFTFDGSVGGGGIGGFTTDLPPGGCNASLIAGYGSGGVPGFVGGFGRTSPRDLTEMTHFTFWINPEAGQDYVIEINLQDDDNGDDAVPGTPDGADDEYQFDCHVSATGPCAVAGGGWQHVSIPIASFFDDNSYHFGGNGVFDPFPVSGGGNGQLVSVVLALVSSSGDDVNFRTDRWLFTNESASISGRVWNDVNGNGLPDGGEPGWNGVGIDLLDSTGTTLQTTTAGDGDYQFTMLPWGEYTVSIQTATLPAGSFATADPDGVGTPHVASALLGCSDTSSARDFGYGSAPNPTALILVTKSGADLEISYDIECNAPDHALLFGNVGDFATVTAAECSIGNSGSTISTPPVGDLWFLVAGSASGRYSGVGQSTQGERTLTGVESQCPSLTVQDLSSTCTVD